MKDWNCIQTFAAIDWAGDHHDLALVSRDGAVLEAFRFEHNAAGWAAMRKRLAAYPNTPVAIETNQGAVVHQLLEGGFAVYPVNPKSAQRYRERKAPTGIKSDQLDAWSLADALRVDGHGWKPLQPQDPLTEELRILCRDEVAFIEQRTALVNQLRKALAEYYPVALEAFREWTAPASWNFVLKFPTPHVLEKAGPRQWEKWLRANRLMRADSPIDRMGVFARALEFKGSEAQIAARSLLAQSCARMLLLLEEQLQQYRRRIEALFADHPDKDLFGSLPGAGPKLAPRILSEMGAHRARFETPGSLQSYAGSAPITIRSGQVCKVRFRHAANSFLRSAVHLWVDLSRKRCAWAQTYYKQHRAKGKSHACAIRCLAQRWLKILWTMWVSRSPYNEALHMQNQIKHGSWILKLQP